MEETKIDRPDLISIIIPVYNIEKYLERCLKSIQSQTYANFEAILIDDGSVDRSVEICDRHAILDSRFKVHHCKNGGPSRARNFGLEKARGNFITFVDGDDWVHPAYLLELYQLILKNPSDISVVNYVKTKSNDSGSLSPEYQFQDDLVLSNIEVLNSFNQRLNPLLVTVWGKLYRRELFDKTLFVEDRLHEDVYILYKLFFQAKSIAFSSKVLYFYWKRPDSITGKFNVKRQLDLLNALIERSNFIYELKLSDQFKRQLAYIQAQYFRLVRNCNVARSDEKAAILVISDEILSLCNKGDQKDFSFRFYKITYPVLNSILYTFGKISRILKAKS